MNKQLLQKIIFNAGKLTVLLIGLLFIFKAGSALAFADPSYTFTQNGFYNTIFKPADLGNYYVKIYRQINGKNIYIGTIGPSQYIGPTYNRTDLGAHLGDSTDPLYDDILTPEAQYNYYLEFYRVLNLIGGQSILDYMSWQNFIATRTPVSLPSDFDTSAVISPTGYNDIKMVGTFNFNNLILSSGWKISGKPQFEKLTLYANKITIASGSKIDYSGAADVKPLVWPPDNDVISDDCIIPGGGIRVEFEPSAGGGGNGGNGGSGSYAQGIANGSQSFPSPGFSALSDSPHGINGNFYSGTRGALLWGTLSFDPYHNVIFDKMTTAQIFGNNGGGILEIKTKLLDNQGQIIANGLDGQSANYGNGGGAGGSIIIDVYKIITSQISSTSGITANGGAGGDKFGPNRPWDWEPSGGNDGFMAGGGGGGGGTIAIKSTIYNDDKITSSGSIVSSNTVKADGGNADINHPFLINYTALPGTSAGENGWKYREPGGEYSLREEEGKSSRSITQGNSATFKISADAINDLDLPVKFSIDTKGVNLTAENITLALNPSGGKLDLSRTSLKSDLVVQTKDSTREGTYKITLISLPDMDGLSQDVSDLFKRTLDLEIIVTKKPISPTPTPSVSPTPSPSPSPTPTPAASIKLNADAGCSGGSPLYRLNWDLVINGNYPTWSYSSGEGFMEYTNAGGNLDSVRTCYLYNNSTQCEATAVDGYAKPGTNITFYFKFYDVTYNGINLGTVESEHKTVYYSGNTCAGDLRIAPLIDITIDLSDTNYAINTITAESSKTLTSMYFSYSYSIPPLTNPLVSFIGGSQCSNNYVGLTSCGKSFNLYINSATEPGDYNIKMRAQGYSVTTGYTYADKDFKLRVINSVQPKAPVTFKGFFIGKSITLNRDANTAPYNIYYDPVAAQNPPPGFADLLAPLWSEATP